MAASTNTQPDVRDTILVAEDDPSILLVEETMLGKQGYRVITASDGKTAQNT